MWPRQTMDPLNSLAIELQVEEICYLQYLA